MKKQLVYLLSTIHAISVSATTLTVYSSAPAILAKELAHNFEKKTGDHVALWTSSTGKVMARLAAEASNPHADVVILADWTAGLELVKAHMVYDYHPKSITSHLYKPMQLKGPFLPIGFDDVSMVMNLKAMPAGAKVPTSWFNLATPVWKNHLTAPNPLLSGTASDFVISFVDRYGSKAWKFFSDLKANGTVWPGPNRASLMPVLSGERSGMVECVGHAAVAAQIQGNSLKLIYPKEGVMLIPRPIIITKSAKDKEIAKQFVNYAMSKSGQELVAKALLYPSLKGVNAIASMPKLGTFPIMTVHWDKIAITRTAVLAKFRKDILDQ